VYKGPPFRSKGERNGGADRTARGTTPQKKGKVALKTPAKWSGGTLWEGNLAQNQSGKSENYAIRKPLTPPMHRTQRSRGNTAPGYKVTRFARKVESKKAQFKSPGHQ